MATETEKPTPCGYPAALMEEKCRTCRQYACHVYQDAPAPVRKLPPWMKLVIDNG